MPTAALAFHAVTDRLFDLSGLRTSSIKDQLLRATLLVEGLAERGLIAPAAADPSRDLLILGAGVAGMQAAYTAASRGVDVTVVEAGSGPFDTLVRSFRRVHPNEYDWPAPHFRDPHFPAVRCAGLFYQAQSAGALALGWCMAWEDWLRDSDGRDGNGRITLKPDTDAAPWLRQWLADCRSGGAQPELSAPFPDATQAPRPFGAVVVCFGHGVERTGEHPASNGRWSGYAGPRYWADYDPLTNAAPGAGGKPFEMSPDIDHVLVSGGGDGALQDWQRTLTGRFGIDLLDALEAAIQRVCGDSLDLEADGWRRLMSAEDSGRRAHAWRQGGGIPQTLLKWHRSFEDIVSHALRRVRPEHCRSILRQLLRPAINEGRLQATWVCRQDVPDHCYALNRFLFCAIDALLQRARPAPGPRLARTPPHVELLWQWQIDSMAPLPAPGAGVVSWDVQLAHTGARKLSARRLRSQLIIVRHGVHGAAASGAVPVPEQLLPYDLPR